MQLSCLIMESLKTSWRVNLDSQIAGYPLSDPTFVRTMIEGKLWGCIIVPRDGFTVKILTQDRLNAWTECH